MEITSASEIEFAFIRDGNDGCMVEMRVIAHPEYDGPMSDLIENFFPLGLELDELTDRIFDMELDEEDAKEALEAEGFVYSADLQAEITADFHRGVMHPEE